jgi:hypothetical protein
MNEHKRFEIMCGLAVVGQANDADLRELKLHIESCVACQTRISDFGQISAQALPLCGDTYPNHGLRKATTARFVERARAEGVPLRLSAQLPGEFFIRPLGWKGNLAAAVLLIMIIANGVSRFGPPRVQSVITTSRPYPELLSEQSIQRVDTQDRSAPRPTKRLFVGQQLRRLHSRFAESAQTSQRPNLEKSSSSSLPLLAAPPIRYLARRHPDQTDPTNQLFPSIADVQRRFFRAYDTKTERPHRNAPLLLALAEYRPRTNVLDSTAADLRGSAATFEIFPLNLTPHVMRYEPDRPLLHDSPGRRSDSFPNIDWYQVWLRTGTPSLRNFNDSSQFHPGALGPGWPFSKEEQQ